MVNNEMKGNKMKNIVDNKTIERDGNELSNNLILGLESKWKKCWTNQKVPKSVLKVD